MTSPNSTNPQSTDVAPIGFAARMPSANWESISLPEGSPAFVWAWFKPPAVPTGLIVRIPNEFWNNSAFHATVTLRRILQAAGVDPASVAMWQYQGLAYPGMNGANPLLDQPLTPPAPGIDPSFVIYVLVPQPTMASPITAPPAAGSRPVDGLTELFERLDAEWNAALDVEKDLDRLRKMLVDMTTRLKALNRDLNPDERLYSSREDKQDWLEARRFLREADNRLRACIKEFDIGDPSSAGHRRYFEHIHTTFVAPRIPFDGMEQALNGFEFYRKLVTTLQGKMNNAFLAAQANGERRAQMVLARIANKVREATNKKTALGVVLDG